MVQTVKMWFEYCIILLATKDNFSNDIVLIVHF